MKKFLGIWFLGLGLILLSSCAKPEVVNIILPGDRELNCGQLEDAFAETRRFKQEAEAIRDPNSGGNVTRGVLFWPALLRDAQVPCRAPRFCEDAGKCYVFLWF